MSIISLFGSTINMV